MRKRERLRIEKLQRQVKTEKARLRRESKKDRSRLDARAESEQFRAMLRAREKVQELQARLVTAKLAPIRAAQRDLAKRPSRYKQPKKRKAKLDQVERKTITQASRIRRLTLSGSEGRAESLLFKAFQSGQSLKDSFKRIAKLTGLSPHKVFTIGKYLQRGSERLEGELESEAILDHEDSPDDFDNF